MPHTRSLYFVVALLLVAACTNRDPSNPTAPETLALAEACELGISDQEARDQINDLIAEVNALEASGALNSGQANALRNHLETALGHIDAGRYCPAKAQLEAFRDQVESFVDNGVLTEEEAESLIEGATDVLEGVPGILWDQFRPPGVGLQCWFTLTPHELWAADFVVPAGTSWVVSRVIFQASIFTWRGPLSIRADDGGVPGEVVHTSTLPVLPEDSFAEVTFVLESPVTLQPGTYWVVVDMRPEPDDGFAWCDIETTNGTEGLRSLDDGGSWDPFLIDFFGYPTYPRKDLAFRLFGTE
jgi:hypothetical protein